jgi:hypothetical protein
MDGEMLGRPFLTGRRDLRLPVDDAAATGASTAGQANPVRPYLITGGRTVGCRTDVAMETIVVVSELVGRNPRRSTDVAAGTSFECRLILECCRELCSVAEVAARLRLPLAVTRILVADLLAEGLLDASHPRPRQADDVQLLERLITGVSAL